MMECPDCRSKVEQDARACPQCGKQLGDETPPSSKNPAPIVSVRAQVSFWLAVGGMIAAVILIYLTHFGTVFFLLFVALMALVSAGRAHKEIRESDGRILGSGIASLGTLIGFGLLVISIVAPFSLPGFYIFHQRARQIEAKSNLGSIWTRQAAYHELHNRYCASFTELEWEPDTFTISRYAFFIEGDSIQPETSGPFPRPDELTIKIESSATGFTAVAVGNIDRDDTLDVWSMDDSRNLRNLVNDVRQ